MFSFILLAFPLLSAGAATSYRRHDHDHTHDSSRGLPSRWYQPDDHPVHALFKRGGPTDGVSYATVGSAAWSKAYPTSVDTSKIPAAWAAALNDAVARKAIPDIPVASNHPNEGDDDEPTYPSGFDPNGPEVCSATYGCRIKGDIWDAPAGHIGISFDDGPLPPTDGLESFLAEQNQRVTHFMIGTNILSYPDQFLKAFNQGDDIAVHTLTHPYMTTLSNLQVVGELGWTMELIHNSTGGRVPKFWRPPYGDSDARTTAIAREVFGLTTIIWNHDTSDWSLNESGGTSLKAINSSMTKWLTGSKSPGLIILEHELTDDSVGAFKSAYPVMKQNGWTLMSLAELMGNGTAYQNSISDSDPVTPVDIIGAKNATAPSSSSSVSNASSTSSSTSQSPIPSTTNNSASTSAALTTPFTLFLAAILTIFMH